MERSTAGWRTSSYSAGQGGNCVELAHVPGVVAVRDSKKPDGPVLLIERHEFRRITATIKGY
ncbi:DUF397 domain-containing protein [Actinomadura kijaniata]|uniref:DUF397 domain-containing protein n=1 Tax=Actinomadura kijaniata TaxID=46161 RepID=UPI000831C6B2|nr:DUF397 domain-containing protein [Actinomadura kijaniata]